MTRLLPAGWRARSATSAWCLTCLAFTGQLLPLSSSEDLGSCDPGHGHGWSQGTPHVRVQLRVPWKFLTPWEQRAACVTIRDLPLNSQGAEKHSKAEAFQSGHSWMGLDACCLLKISRYQPSQERRVARGHWHRPSGCAAAAKTSGQQDPLGF